MAEHDNIQVVEAWCEAVNAHDVERICETLAEDAVWELGAESVSGSEAYKKAWQFLFQGFPDLKLEIEQQLTDGPYAVVRSRIKGTHRGELQLRGSGAGIPATESRIDIPVCSIYLIAGGKIARGWVYWDTATLLRQIGALSGPAEQRPS